MSICNEIQQKIAELESQQIIENQEYVNHIASCEDCQNYQLACDEMNHAMKDMGEYDAEDALVESTLNSILTLQKQSKKPPHLLSTQWASGLAASFMLISLIALFPYNSISNYGMFSDTDASSQQLEKVSEEEKQKIKKRKEANSKKKDTSNDFEFIEIDIAEERNVRLSRAQKKSSPSRTPPTIDDLSAVQSDLGSVDLEFSNNEDLKANRDALADILQDEFKQDAKKELAKLTTKLVPNSSMVKISQPVNGLEKKSKGVKLNSDGVGQVLINPDSVVDELEEVIVVGSDQSVRDNVDRRYDSDEQQDQVLEEIVVTGRRVRIREDATVEISGVEVKKNESTNVKNYAGLFSHRSAKSTNDGTKAEYFKPLSPAKIFLQELSTLGHKNFQTASGYWANTYLPGDASMRMLAGNLIQKDANIESIVEQNKQPFDYPSNSALAVYLNSDHSNVNAQEPTRMKLQVGIQASNRKGGHRSAMNIGLVLDVRDDNFDSIEKVKALLLALLKEKQASDSISVILAGNNGGMLIKPNEFRYGTIQAMLNNLTTAGNKSKSVPLSLHEAIKIATVNLQKDDDPTASLGSSVVMLVTDEIILDSSAISSTIHKNALDGITLSTISLDGSNKQLNQLALTGQGHARVLQNLNDANRVVEAEILASSRAVARALRLRIRLAKGVELIKVLDSYNLNEAQAQRVRDAEKSLDQRLSKNLGIQADRGEDEEGIQIVIPSFFAGDTHVIILDVLVKNPGAIADVSLRYKDLLYSRNAIARKQLNLGKEEKTTGPLQLNVLKNVLASRFSKKLRLASDALKKGNNKSALLYLSTLQKLYQSMRLEFPAWNNDKEIIKDEKLIQHYINLINKASKNDAPQVNYIVDSLQYISWRKRITRSK